MSRRRTVGVSFSEPAVRRLVDAVFDFQSRTSHAIRECQFRLGKLPDGAPVLWVSLVFRVAGDDEEYSVTSPFSARPGDVGRHCKTFVGDRLRRVYLPAVHGVKAMRAREQAQAKREGGGRG